MLTWIYGTISVLIISIVGLLMVVFLPTIQHDHESNSAQLFVGLAIGTLMSDAFLHLLPHAFSSMTDHHVRVDSNASSMIMVLEEHPHLADDGDHREHHTESRHSHSDVVWFGLVSLMGIISFLVFERVITIFTGLLSHSHNHSQNGNGNHEHEDHHLHREQKKKKTTKKGKGNKRNSVKNGKVCDANGLQVGTNEALEAAEHDKLNPDGDHGGYDDHDDYGHDHHHPYHHQHSHELKDVVHPLPPLPPPTSTVIANGDCGTADLNGAGLRADTTTIQVLDECHRSTVAYPNPNGEGYMHLASHHHHHQHQHQSVSPALMVLCGDLLHNLFDGLAIGIAFAGSGIGGGISTSIAVLFHELPHELGDFSIVLRSGMPLRQALYWNIGASIVCWFGMCLGIFLGSMKDAGLSAFIAGTFIYIALVDMIPEMDSCPHWVSGRRVVRLSFQLLGIALGCGIMLLISLYEDQMMDLVWPSTMNDVLKSSPSSLQASSSSPPPPSPVSSHSHR